MALTMKVSGSVRNDLVLCENDSGAKVTAGGEGPSAMELLLMAVVGCSGATLKAIMGRDGLTPEAIDIKAEGVRSETTPKRFTDIHLHYTVSCQGLSTEKLQHYLGLTEKVCPVIQSLNVKTHLTYELLNR
ncbi:MAG TPA: OsmC family protein [Firmicutes bacterium]|nr:OsmC family protein [Candidatus Fermentithermobacillaceae bacterium]